MLLFLAGFPLIVIDSVMGYNHATFTLVAIGLWFAALFTLIYHMSRRLKGQSVPEQFVAARDVIDTLRDDLDPKRNFFGHLDLTGNRLPAKMTREAKNQAGHTVQFFRDEWLSLKAKLYDGNVLKLSVIDWAKVRKGYWKRGSSGKSKWKSAKEQTGQELSARVSVNSEIYDFQLKQLLQPGTRIGNFTVNDLQFNDGILSVSASANAGTVNSKDVLNVLRRVYGLLQRRGAA